MQSLEDKTSLENRVFEELGERSLFQKVSDMYFEPKSFERSGKLYESLGVKQFKKFVLAHMGRDPLEREYGSNYYIKKDNSIKSIKRFEKETRSNESIHLEGAMFFGFVAGLCLVNGIYGPAAAVGVSFLINAYPIMLQRYNRSRIYNVLEKKENRTDIGVN